MTKKGQSATVGDGETCVDVFARFYFPSKFPNGEHRSTRDSNLRLR